MRGWGQVYLWLKKNEGWVVFFDQNKNILPKFYLFKNGAFKVSLSFNALNLAFGRNYIVILLWRYFRQIQTRTNRLISELGDDFEICLDWIWSYRVFPLEYGNALRSFGLEQLIDIIPPCDKAHYEAYHGAYDHRFRHTDVQIKRIMKFQLKIIDFINNNAELVKKYKH